MKKGIHKASRGYLLVSISILLVSIAQLVMKYALIQLPPLYALHEHWQDAAQSWLLLASGVLCYLLSLIAWYFALRHVALGKAYAMLSISYALVWLGSVVLPFYQVAFSLRAVMGVAAIMTGVLLVCWPQRASGSI